MSAQTVGSVRVFLGFRGLLPYFLTIRPGHVVIYGRTGSGKTNTAKLLASVLSRHVPVLVLDWAGEYEIEGFRRMKPGEDLRINPLEYVTGELSEHIDFLVDLFGDTFDFTEPQRFMFREALKRAFSESAVPTIADLLDALQRVPPRSYYDHEIKAAIRRRLTQLAEGRIGRAFSHTHVNLSGLFEENVVVDLSAFRSVHSRVLFTLILLKLLYDYAVYYRGRLDGIAHATVVEEAWNVIPYRRLDSRPTIGERLFAELRKYGECIIAVSQSPTETAWSITKNAQVIVIHSSLSKDAETMGLVRGGDVSLEELSVGEALVISEGKRRIVKVRLYRVGSPLREAVSSMGRFAARLAAKLTGLVWRRGERV